MRIEFEGPSYRDILIQIDDFLAFSRPGVGLTNPTFADRKGNIFTPVEKPSPLNGQKRPPGRPPKPDSKKGLAAAEKAKQSKVINLHTEEVEQQAQPAESSDEWCGRQESNLRPSGSKTNEPSPQNTVENTQSAPKITPKITKENLAEILQKLCEKSGDQVAGITKVRHLFDKFGVKRLGELDEKRYHELYHVVQQELGLLSPEGNGGGQDWMGET